MHSPRRSDDCSPRRIPDAERTRDGPGAHDDLPGDCQRIDASGRIVAPGLVDLGVELREPGCEEDETIETGTAAALAGGFTSIVCLPNTDPPIDTQAGEAPHRLA